MARTVQDLALFLDAMTMDASDGSHPAVTAGWEGYGDAANVPHPEPSSSWQAVAEEGARSVPARGAAAAGGGGGGGEGQQPGPRWRVAYSNLGCPVTAEIEAVCRRAAESLARAMSGAALIEAPDPFDVQAAEDTFFVQRAGMFDGMFERLPPETSVTSHAARARRNKPWFASRAPLCAGVACLVPRHQRSAALLRTRHPRPSSLGLETPTPPIRRPALWLFG